jgi:hypothetical protein
MPTQFRTTMKYSSPVTYTSGTGTCGVHVFSANGLYDPDITSTGHQPRGFDQLMAMYDHYVVISSAIRVVGQVISSVTGDSYNGIAGICVRDANSVETVPNEYLEQGWNKWLYVSSTDGFDIRHSVDVSKFLGRQSILSDPYLKGTKTANPTEDVLFHLWIAHPASASTDALTCYATAEIAYDLWLIEPSDPGTS